MKGAPADGHQLQKERITMNAIEKMLCLLVLLPCITLGLLLMSRGKLVGFLILAVAGFLLVKLLFFTKTE
jgi:hypothetical protein